MMDVIEVPIVPILVGMKGLRQIARLAVPGTITSV